MSKSSTVLTLDEYLGDVQALLHDWPRERLETWILDQARVQSPRERRDFLADLKGATQAPETAPFFPSSLDLLARIDEFIEELESGIHYREPEWGDDDREDYLGDDKLWVEAWDELLAEARQACLKGNWELGAPAYEKLLQAFALQEEDEVFGEDISPERALESDLTEATLLYLRAVYETVPESERAASVLAAMEALYLHPKEATLAALAATGPSAIEGFQAFVADLTSRLEARGPGAPSGWDGYRDWLPEAMIICRGEDGLREFLVTNRFQHPEACREHLRQTFGNRDWDKALDTARAASKALEDPRQKAEMLDAAAYAAAQAGLSAESAEYRQGIWRLEPGEFHLLAWLGSCPQGDWKERLAEELAILPMPQERFPTAGKALWTLLRDSWSDLAESLAKAQRPLPWDRGMRRLYYLLAVATLDSLEPPPATLLAQAWWDAGRAEPEPWGKRTDLVPEPELTLGLQNLFAWKRATTPMEAATRTKVRDTLLDVSRRWCTGILKAGDRQAYFDAARLLGIAVETLILAGQAEGGRQHLQDMLAAFPRHRAFVQELATVRSQSALL